jgi:hypothetical protein
VQFAGTTTRENERPRPEIWLPDLGLGLRFPGGLRRVAGCVSD